jgi:hypothetical protein
MNEDLQQKWETVCDRLAALGFEKLEDSERLWISVRGLIDSVENGGISSYFYNSFADYLTECKRGLEILGISEVKVQLERACSLFPDGVPSTGEARNQVMGAWGEDVETTLDDIDLQLENLFPELELKLDAYILNS